MNKFKISSKQTIRRSYVDIFFEENVKVFPPGASILDIGGKKLRKRGSFNIEQYGLTVKYANLDASTEPDYLCNASEIPVEDNAFEGIIIAELLEHVPEPKAVLKEAFRILKQNGYALITAPFLFPVHADPYDYGRYTRHWYLENLQNIGFSIINIENQDNLYSVVANNYRLMANHYGKKITLKNLILQYFYLMISNHYIWKEFRVNKNSENFKYFEKFSTGFGVICRK